MAGQRCRTGEDIDASLSEGVAMLRNRGKRNLSRLFRKDTDGGTFEAPSATADVTMRTIIAVYAGGDITRPVVANMDAAIALPSVRVMLGWDERCRLSCDDAYRAEFPVNGPDAPPMRPRRAISSTCWCPSSCSTRLTDPLSNLQLTCVRTQLSWNAMTNGELARTSEALCCGRWSSS